MAHNKIHTLTAAVITALTLGLVACGNDQKPAAPAAPAASAAASAPASVAAPAASQVATS